MGRDHWGTEPHPGFQLRQERHRGTRQGIRGTYGYCTVLLYGVHTYCTALPSLPSLRAPRQQPVSARCSLIYTVQYPYVPQVAPWGVCGSAGSAKSGCSLISEIFSISSSDHCSIDNKSRPDLTLEGILDLPPDKQTGCSTAAAITV
jgi:hypothetical protein